MWLLKRCGNGDRGRPGLLIVLALMAAGSAQAAPDSTPADALADYVAAPDDSYGWQVHARYSVPGADIVELHLRSQTWHGTLWKHQLFIVKPVSVDDDVRQGLLVVAGGRWRDRYETETRTELPDDVRVFVQMAQRANTVLAVLGQVPFQPMFGLTEDNLIAYSFDEYLETGDATWPLLLPMVKSAVKAMDATQAFTRDEWQMQLLRFTVLGGSKRGWTTWLTGAVEPRAAALIPVVIDALNFKAHMPYQTKVWGAPSKALEPYTKRGLLKVLSSPRGRALRRIVDPYSYRQRLTQPKLIVVATNDPYFPVDSLNLYWDALPDPKYALYLPNSTHHADDFGRIIPAVAAFHRASAGGTPLAKLEWEYQAGPDRLRLCVRADPRPQSVVAWTAASDDRDFRDATFSQNPVAPQRGAYVFDLARPAGGYAAVFAESLFGGGADRYPLSTNLRVIGARTAPAIAATAIRGHTGVCPPAH
jgi:PhoPQ-activated pathogenicity-related protein